MHVALGNLRFFSRSKLTYQLIFFFIILAVGTWGFQEARPTSDFWDSLYRALQLFALNFEVEPTWDGDLWSLYIVRFLAPIFSILWLVSLASARLSTWLHTQVQSWRNDRIIFLGYGQVNKALIVGLCEKNRGDHTKTRAITIVDSRFDEADRKYARSVGALLIEADLTDAKAIERLKPGNAERVYVACGSDAVNLEIGTLMAQAIDKARRKSEGNSKEANRRYGCRRGSCDETVKVHIASPKLMSDLTRSRDTEHPFGPGLQFFSFKDAIAATLIARARLPERAKDLGRCKPHVVILGAGELAQAIVEHCLNSAVSSMGVPRITLFDLDASAAERRFKAHYPRLFDDSLPRSARSELTIEFHSVDIGELCFESDPRLTAMDNSEATPTCWIFACRDEEKNLEAALRLDRAMQSLRRSPAPIFARAWDAELETSSRTLGYTQTFGQHSDEQVTKRLTSDWLGWFARAVHDAYGFDKRFSATIAASDDSDAYLAHWANLPKEIQEVNYRVALHLPQRLHDFGYDWRGRKNGVIPRLPTRTDHEHLLKAEVGKTASDDGGKEEPIASGLLETARIEHLRWMLDRALQGEEYGTTRSKKMKLHPSMVDFDADPNEPKKPGLDNKTKRLDLTALRAAFSPRVSDAPLGRPLARVIELQEMPIEALEDLSNEATCVRIHFGMRSNEITVAQQNAFATLVSQMGQSEAVCRVHIVRHGLEPLKLMRKVECDKVECDKEEADEALPFLRWLSMTLKELSSDIIVDFDDCVHV